MGSRFCQGWDLLHQCNPTVIYRQSHFEPAARKRAHHLLNSYVFFISKWLLQRIGSLLTFICLKHLRNTHSKFEPSITKTKSSSFLRECVKTPNQVRYLFDTLWMRFLVLFLWRILIGIIEAIQIECIVLISDGYIVLILSFWQFKWKTTSKVSLDHRMNVLLQRD